MLWGEMNPSLFAPESVLCGFLSGAPSATKPEAQPSVRVRVHAEAFAPVQIPVVCSLPGIR